MSKDNLTQSWYFASPIYFMNKPEWVSDLDKLSDPYIKLAKEKNKNFIDERNKNWGGDKKDHALVHHSSSLIGRPGFKKFTDYIEATTWNLLDEQGYDLTNYKIFTTEMWVQEFAEAGGGHHSLHTHYNGHISGFYFLKASEKTSLPIFDDPRAGKLMNDLPQKDANKITPASTQVNYTVRPGDLIVFNSYLPHQFRVDDAYEPFRFIHFNCRAIPINDVLSKYGEERTDNKKYKVDYNI
tara:strand:+ start:2371 stop:3090 length:720 start_codon:yes stop_codon:yes gene_type:complete